ncbi:MAG: SH3 domain-containing protein, partial [Oscillospiraceae bacterium]|nr:SH3 domain-containing protein [Oscillospiraceae bacterium]
MYIGKSGETVAKSGCAVTSAAMLMVQSGSVTDADFNPGTIISYLNQNGGFSSSGSINWNKLSGYAPNFTYVRNYKLSGTQQQKAATMQSLMDDGYYLLAVVKYGGHFVAIDSVDGSNVTMMDPGSRSTSLFDKYAADGVISLRLFTGANSHTVQPAEPEPTAPEMIEPETTEAVTEATEVSEEAETTEAQEMTAPEMPTEAETEPIETIETTAVTTQVAETTQVTIATEAVLTEPPAPAAAEPVKTTAAPNPTTTVTTQVVPVTPPSPEVMEEVQLPLTAPELPQSEIAQAEMAVIPSHAEASLFKAAGQHFYMQVKFRTTDNLHLRENPDTNSDILLVIPTDTVLDVVEVNDDFTWGRVAYNGEEGWISLY